MKMRVLSCGAKSPRDCFNCPFTDCVCADSSTPEEGKWMLFGNPKRPSKAKGIETASFSVEYDTTRREVKSSLRRNNYEYLFF